MSRTVKIGILGLGHVGSRVAELLRKNRQSIVSRTGVDIEIRRVLVRNAQKTRKGIDPRLITTKPSDVLDDGCDIIVELLGGVDPASSFVQRALEARRHVVTANKALLAMHGADLFRRAGHAGVTIGFEASVCGAVPIVRALRSGLAGDSITSIRGILNGTCNFILSAMEEGLEAEQALVAAQRLGFAEADPSLDLDGEDAAQKIQILADLVHGNPAEKRVRVEGIRRLTRQAVVRARRNGRWLRLVASATWDGDRVEIRVGPELLSPGDPLTHARGENNAVIIRSEAAGELFLLGPGAGGLPTASAVIADIVEVAKTMR